ncbi:MAG TPA: recombinase family protein, partial [Polyangiaceae bacterium]
MRQTWLWLRSENLDFPQRFPGSKAIRWGKPTHIAIREILINPVYAGAYVHGKTRTERYVVDHGQVRKRCRKVARSEWAVFIRDYHEGYIDWDTFQMNQKKIASNIRPESDDTGGAAREGAALLQGLGRCGHCGRGLDVSYGGKDNKPYYFCTNDQLMMGRGVRCLWISGRIIHEPITDALLTALKPAGTAASLKAAERDPKPRFHHRAMESTSRAHALRSAGPAERRYRAVDPENRLVARGLEKSWEGKLHELQDAEAELAQRQHHRPQCISASDREALLTLGKDLRQVWSSATTTIRNKKDLMRALLEEVTISIPKPTTVARVVLRWHGGMLTELGVP